MKMDPGESEWTTN